MFEGLYFMNKSIIGQAQTRKSAFYRAEIEIEYVPARQFWVYFQKTQILD